MQPIFLQTDLFLENLVDREYNISYHYNSSQHYNISFKQIENVMDLDKLRVSAVVYAQTVLINITGEEEKISFFEAFSDIDVSVLQSNDFYSSFNSFRFK